MNWFGNHPNLSDLRRLAWEKAREHFPDAGGSVVSNWIPGGFGFLDVDGTEIGGYLGAEALLWRMDRPIGLSAEGLIIPYGDEDDFFGEGPLPPLCLPWTCLQPGFDGCHFNVVTNVVTTLRLSEEAASAVRARLEVPHA